MYSISDEIIQISQPLFNHSQSPPPKNPPITQKSPPKYIFRPVPVEADYTGGNAPSSGNQYGKMYMRGLAK